jgi:hypothetical protein
VDRSRVACSLLDALPLGCEGDRPFRPSVAADVSRKRLLRLGQPPSAGCRGQYAGAKHIGERAFTLANACGVPEVRLVRELRRCARASGNT